MDSRVTDYRQNKRCKDISLVYCTRRSFSEISDVLTTKDFKVSINTVYSQKGKDGKGFKTEIVLNVRLKRKPIESLVNDLLADEKCISIYLVDPANIDAEFK